jgi:hypothetical protein
MRRACRNNKGKKESAKPKKVKVKNLIKLEVPSLNDIGDVVGEDKNKTKNITTALTTTTLGVNGDNNKPKLTIELIANSSDEILQKDTINGNRNLTQTQMSRSGGSLTPTSVKRNSGGNDTGGTDSNVPNHLLNESNDVAASLVAPSNTNTPKKKVQKNKSNLFSKTSISTSTQNNGNSKKILTQIEVNEQTGPISLQSKNTTNWSPIHPSSSKTRISDPATPKAETSVDSEKRKSNSEGNDTEASNDSRLESKTSDEENTGQKHWWGDRETKIAATLTVSGVIVLILGVYWPTSSKGASSVGGTSPNVPNLFITTTALTTSNIIATIAVAAITIVGLVAGGLWYIKPQSLTLKQTVEKQKINNSFYKPTIALIMIFTASLAAFYIKMYFLEQPKTPKRRSQK